MLLAQSFKKLLSAAGTEVGSAVVGLLLMDILLCIIKSGTVSAACTEV